LNDKSYKDAMLKLKEIIATIDGQKNAAETIWNKIKDL
jgi:uncharacterized coiled-coil DUF342 family protein